MEGLQPMCCDPNRAVKPGSCGSILCPCLREAVIMSPVVMTIDTPKQLVFVSLVVLKQEEKNQLVAA